MSVFYYGFCIIINIYSFDWKQGTMKQWKRLKKGVNLDQHSLFVYSLSRKAQVVVCSVIYKYIKSKKTCTCRFPAHGRAREARTKQRAGVRVQVPVRPDGARAADLGWRGADADGCRVAWFHDCWWLEQAGGRGWPVPAAPAAESRNNQPVPGVRGASLCGTCFNIVLQF